MGLLRTAYLGVERVTGQANRVGASRIAGTRNEVCFVSITAQAAPNRHDSIDDAAARRGKHVYPVGYIDLAMGAAWPVT